MKSVITNCGGKNMILQNLMQDGGNNGKGRPTSTEFIKTAGTTGKGGPLQ